MIPGLLNRESLETGIKVLVIGAAPRDVRVNPYSGELEPYTTERIEGELLSWAPSRFGGMFCEAKIGDAIKTYAMTDLVKV